MSDPAHQIVQADSLVDTNNVMLQTDARISEGTKAIFDPAEQGLLPGALRLLTSGTAYWCYAGIAPANITIAKVRSVLTGNGSGTVVAEMAVASSTTAPTGSALTLTHIASSGTVTDMTSGSQKVVEASVGAVVAKGTPMWFGMRTAYGTTQPTMASLGFDQARGRLCITAGASALTGGGTWTATPIAFVAVNTQQAPHLVGTTF